MLHSSESCSCCNDVKSEMHMASWRCMLCAGTAQPSRLAQTGLLWGSSSEHTDMAAACQWMITGMLTGASLALQQWIAWSVRSYACVSLCSQSLLILACRSVDEELLGITWCCEQLIAQMLRSYWAYVAFAGAAVQWSRGALSGCGMNHGERVPQLLKYMCTHAPNIFQKSQEQSCTNSRGVTSCAGTT